MKLSLNRLTPVILAAFALVTLQNSVSAQAQRQDPIAEKLGAPPVRDTARRQNSNVGLPPLDEMIGQMIMVGFRGKNPSDKGVRAVRQLLKKGTIGGVILFGINIESPKQTRALNKAIANSGAKYPVLIAVDQEGGHVQRLSSKNGFAYTNSHEKIARKYTPKVAREKYDIMARDLVSAGFNVNFGPVVDVDVQGKRNPIIGKLRRSFSDDPSKVTTYARTFINAHRNRNILTSAKHFPGHGSSLTDSHKGFTDLSRTWKKQTELAPFFDLSADERPVDMVMVGHLYHRKFSDGPGIPATLSSKAVKGLLRGEVGYQGVAITDDMEMGAIRKNFKHRDAIIMAVNAGMDILLYSNTAKYSTKLGPRIHATISKAVADGIIPEGRIIEAYTHIQAMKRALERRS